VASRRISDDGALPSLREAIRLSKLKSRPATDADRPRRRSVKPKLFPGQLSIDDIDEREKAS
jgi:hypothetical protein